MGKFRIFETDQFREDLAQNFEGQGRKVVRKLREYVYPQLRDNPYFGKNIKKLKNYQPETWRYRIRNYRIFYKIDEKEGIVYMLALDFRKDSYK